MRSFLILLLMISATGVFSQSIERSVISSTGSLSSASSIQLSATVGEAIVATNSGGSIILTQGFQQSYLTGIGISTIEHNINISLYPNPAMHTVTLQYTLDRDQNIQFQVYDAIGRTRFISPALNATGSASIYEIDISDYTSGVYYLKIIGERDNDLGTYRIVKLK